MRKLRQVFALGVALFAAVPRALSAGPAEELNEPPLKDSDRQHWSFRKPIRPEIPPVKDAARVRNPIDAFIQQKRVELDLPVNKPAEKLTLLRRVTFDLTGLPPTPSEIDDYLKDERADAYERVVDRLMASPHFGERWAQHWLDVVRYAESNGYEGDGERPSAWRYRDYVVNSFNDDKPFDQFVREQIAGDELAAGKDVRTAAELWVATGLHRCGPVHLVSGNIDPQVARQEVLTEMVQGVGAAFLGLTVNCARCHDHKFDPVSQADYYRLEAFFASTRPKEVDFSTPEERAAMQAKILAIMGKVAPLKTKVAAIDAPYQQKLREAKRAKLEPHYRAALDADPKQRSAEQVRLAKEAETLLKVTWDEIVGTLTPEDQKRRAALRAEQHALEAELPPPPSQAWAVVDDGKPVTTHVLKRGEVSRKGAVVQPAFPRVLSTGAAGKERLTRLDLARWLTSPENPLVARVFVNRLWQHHFGRGLVATPNDFGARGARPTHPELLDWLAVELVEGGWKVKRLHRLMVLSDTYRQSSANAEFGVRNAESNPKSIDPDNKFFWRMNRRRLEGEALRDAVLTAAGTLNREVGGPMVRVPLEPEVYDLIFTEGEPDGLWPVTKDVKQHTRRSLYLFAKRNVRQPFLEAFDQPDRLTPCGGRAVSTFAPQALILMNGPLAQAQSRALAARLLREEGADEAKQIAAAYRCSFARSPRASEKELARTFLKDQAEASRARLRAGKPLALPPDLPADADPAYAAALADFCLALFNANEFVYVP
jgi:hypothetical protein